MKCRECGSTELLEGICRATMIDFVRIMICQKCMKANVVLRNEGPDWRELLVAMVGSYNAHSKPSYHVTAKDVDLVSQKIRERDKVRSMLSEAASRAGLNQFDVMGMEKMLDAMSPEQKIEMVTDMSKWYKGLEK